MAENAVLEGGSVETGADNSDSGASVESPQAMNGLESLKHKTTSDTTSSDDNINDVSAETDSDKADSKDVDKKEESAIDPEIAEFLKGKDIDLGDLAGNETAMSLVNSLRDSEAEKTKIQNEHQLENDAMARKKAEANVEKVLEAGKEDKPVPLSPLKQAQENYVSSVSGLMDLMGVDSVDALAEKHPDVFGALKRGYDASKDEAQAKEYEWHKGQETEAAAQKEAQDAVQREYDGVKAKAADMITEAKKDYPELADDFEKYGINEFVDSYGKLSGIPSEYFVAEKGFFDFMTKAAANARIVEGIPEMESKLKTSLEKQINNTKKAETVSSDDLLPDDHRAAANAKFKRSFGDSGKGTRI